MSKPNYSLGWVRDLPDHRDFHYINHNEYKLASAKPLPEKACLLSEMPPVKDQLQVGSCVWNGIATVLEFLQLKAIKKVPGYVNIPESFGDVFTTISRLFGYYCSRKIDGTVHSDNGTHIRTGIKVARNIGIVEESLWPYDPNLLFVIPVQKAFEEAKKHRVLTAYRLDHTHVEELKACLASGFPIVFGVPLSESFMHTGHDGQVPMPGPNDSFVGGHCMVIFSYDSTTQCFGVRNSWGHSFGDHGNVYLPFEYIRTLAADLWTIRNE